MNRIVARAAVALCLALACSLPRAAPDGPRELAEAFRAEVDRRLVPPPEEAARYGELARDALSRGSAAPIPQYLVLVDRDPRVQAILIYWLQPDAPPFLVGAAAASTGRSGGFEHFETPLGIFEHTPDNPDFRAEGTRNAQGIRGYGARGMRVFDFGWQEALRLWGAGGRSPMRLQMHATDPQRLEPRLGSVQSKGCIRIPASLNRFLDLHGILDADYLAAAAQGAPPGAASRSEAGRRRGALPCRGRHGARRTPGLVAAALTARGHAPGLIHLNTGRGCGPQDGPTLSKEISAMAFLSNNVGALDRAVRIILGVLLIALAAMERIGVWGYVGVLPLVTGVLGTCPAYSLLGISTCAREPR